MRARLSPLVPAIAAAVAITAPISSPAQPCTGVAEIWGNDMLVTLVESDTKIGVGLSYFAHGPALYSLWNDYGTAPTAHAAGSLCWAFTAGTLAHELGHNLHLGHGGPVPTVNDNREVVFLASDNGRLYKLDAQTGAALAFVDTRRPGCAEDALLATPTVQLYSYSNAAFQSAILAERGKPDDLVFVVTATGCGDATHNRIIAYYASNLSMKWVFNPSGAYSMGDAHDGCEIDYGSNVLYCGTAMDSPGQNTLWAVQTLSPSLLWSQNAGNLQNRPRLKPGPPGTPALELYVASSDGILQKYDPTSGSLAWAYPTGSPIVRNPWPEFRGALPTRIYCVTEDGLLHGYMDNFPAPVPLWPPVSPGPGLKYSSAPVVASGLNQAYVGRNDGFLQQVSLDGVAGPVEQVGLPGSVYDPSLDVSGPAEPDFDRLMVSTTEGSVKRYCIPWGTTTTVPGSQPVAESALDQNAPNPFSVSTRIEYRLPYDARVEVGVYDLDGHRVRTLVRDREAGGPHQVAWNGLDDAGRSVASGLYFYRLSAAGPEGRSFERTKKVQVVR